MNEDLNQDILQKIFCYETDGSLYWKDHPRKGLIGKKAGYKKQRGYIGVTIFGKAYRMSRVVWTLHNGPIPAGLLIDHINCVRNDNRIENLRLATASENNRNTIKHLNGHPVGVSLNSSTGKWQAEGDRSNGKRNYIGLFNTKEEAAVAVAVFTAERERSRVLVEALDQINGECFEWGCDKIAREALDKYHGKEINVLS